jgi:hypothetical protein
MKSGVRGIASVKALKASLRALPTSVAHGIAKQAAPEMTGLTTKAFFGKRNVYGDARPAGVDGHPLTLIKSGRTLRTLEFTANGTTVRAVLGTPWAKYLIGKYGILPNGALPVAWSQALRDLAARYKVTL